MRYCEVTPPTPSSHHRWRAITLVGAGLLALVAVLIVGGLVLIRTAYFQQSVIRYAANRLNHHIDVHGAFNLNLLSSTPTLTATDVTLSNPSWMPPGTVAEIGKVTVVFDSPWPGRHHSIQRLEMLSAKLHLVRDADGRANWQWRAPGVPKKGQGLLIRSLNMPNAHVVLEDSRRHLQFDGAVTAGDVSGMKSQPPLRIEGSGRLNGRPATFSIDGEPLATARHDRPYGFSFLERSGDSQLRGRGHLLRPFDPGILDAEFAANGLSMRELYFLAGLHFAESAPFTLTGRIERRGPQSRFSDLVAHFGRSDVRGTVALAVVDGQPRFNANLSSTLLRLQDFGRHQPDGSPLRPSSPSSLLLSDSQVPLNSLRNHDGVVRYRADSVESHAMAVGAFSGQAAIERGVLTATQLSGRVRESHVTGTVKIDVRGDVPRTTLDLTMTDLPLAQFARKENARPPFEGMLKARLEISGRGNSLHELAASATGTLALSMSHGAMRASMAEMTATTLRGLGLTLTHSDKETPVRCGVATFRAREGVLSAERIVVDTDPVLITGVGNVHLGTETLDLTLRGEPRRPRLIRLHAPVSVAGPLKHPSVKMTIHPAEPLPALADVRAEDGLACEPALALQPPGD